MIDRINKVESLKQSPLFTSLPQEALEKIAAKAKMRQFFPDETVVWQGKASDSLYLIINGIVAVKKIIASGKEQIFAYLMAGNTFGEVGILENQPRSATVSALSDVDVLVIQRDDFIQMMHDYPQIGIGLCKMLGKYLVESNRRQTRASKKARLILVFSLTPHAGGTNIGNTLARILHGQTKQSTVYTEYPTPQNLITDLNIRKKTRIYKHNSGYDILLSQDENTELPLSARLTLFLDSMMSDYDNIIMTLKNQTYIDENLAMLLEFVNQIIIVTPPLEDGMHVVNRLHKQIRDHVRSDEATIFTIINRCSPEHEKVQFNGSSDFDVPYLPDLPSLVDSEDAGYRIPRPIEEMLGSIIDRLERTHQIGVFIPSTVSVDKPIDTSKYVEQTLKFLAERFGGATSKEAKGVWNSKQVGLVDEKVYVVHTYVTQKDMNKYLDEVVDYIKVLKIELDQEAMALEIDKKMTII
ncbi:cyclic nucleotide-binding domain-containing protein [Bernardetia sp.]|uniref:cyclic nucleotide-binding domain-containing protein n=1 Tax=Bernardetia sp. TaxID=1937974 RepID=UPI0025BB28C9|nr:cyclic nucleotide-binding domain-containing protein [Bernardetia sp.]